MRDNITRMQAYRWGEQPDSESVIKLNSNENPYPVSQTVSRVLNNFDVADLRRYPNAYADQLRAAIASRHGINREQVLVTNGGDEALRLVITTFVDPKGKIGATDPTYSLYEVLGAIQDAELITIPLSLENRIPQDFSQQLNAKGVSLAFIVNPHAPSGALTSVANIASFAEGFNGVLLLDEAYVDFVDPALQYDATKLIAKLDNLLILRSFSKGYSLAGLRLGYLLGTKSLIEPILTKTRDSYNVDAISQALGLAAFSDQEYAQQTWSKVRSERIRLREQLTRRGFTVPESHSNFLLATPSGEESAAAVYQRLKSIGILVRHFDTPLLADKLRITVGTERENTALLKALEP